MTFPDFVKIVEVGPRDGLQHEKKIIPTPAKIELINKLSETGLKHIEATSFVSPKYIPQLADSEEVFKRIHKKEGISYPVIVPNLQGFERSQQAGAKKVAILCAASDTFSAKNTNCTIEESFKRNEAILQQAAQRNIPVRGYLSCALGCPYEGNIDPKKVQALAVRLMDLGCEEISLGDTIGIGTPLQAKKLVETLAKKISLSQIAIHFHDTYGQALANIYACLELGIHIVDSAIGGLGGCPYAKGASGNVATEDVLYLLQGLGIKTGVDLDAVVAVSQFAMTLTHQTPRSKVVQAKLGLHP